MHLQPNNPCEIQRALPLPSPPGRGSTHVLMRGVREDARWTARANSLTPRAEQLPVGPRPGGEGNGGARLRALFPLRSAFAPVCFCILFAHAAICAEPEANQPMEQMIGRFRADRNGLNNFYETMRPSAFFEDRCDALYGEWKDKLAAFNFDSLDQQGRIDFLMLRDSLKHERAVIGRNKAKLSAVEPLIPFHVAIQELESARSRMEPLDGQAAATKVSAIPEQIKKLRERIEKGRKEKEAKKDDDKAKPDDTAIKLEPLQAKRAAESVDELRGALRAWNGFYDGYLPEFNWWMKTPYDEANKAMEEYSKYLREEVAGLKGKPDDPLIGEPIGAQALKEDLERESIPYTPEELITIGEREFAWCEARMKEASHEMGLGDDWKAAMAKVKEQHEVPGKQDQLITQQAHEAIDFVKQLDLVTVPKFCEETWRVTMLGVDGQKTMPYAAYGGLQLLAAYPRQEMKNDDKLMSMRGNNRHFQRIVTAHELIPGHHLQAYYAARYRPYREQFWTSFYVEGWALYWEMKLWDLNYAKTPEDKIGMLFWRMHRSARIIVSLKYHLGLMKPNEMIDFIMQRVGHERFGATSEVRRFIQASPLYQCGYMLGALQLTALHKQIVGAGKMGEKEFNDAVLKYGTIPIEYIRAGMLVTPLARDTKSSWKFAEPN